MKSIVIGLLLLITVIVSGCIESNSKNQNPSNALVGKWEFDSQSTFGDTIKTIFIFNNDYTGIWENSIVGKKFFNYTVSGNQVNLTNIRPLGMPFYYNHVEYQYEIYGNSLIIGELTFEKK